MTESGRQPASRRRLLLRGVGAGVVGLLWLVVAGYAASFLSLASTWYGWLTTGALLSAGLAGTAALFRLRPLTFWLIAALVIGMAIGTAMWRVAPPELSRLVTLADKTPIPEGWQQASHDERGNTWCFKGCPQVERRYTVSSSSADQLGELSQTVTAAGWKRSGALSHDSSTVFTKGRWQVWFTTETRTDHAQVVLRWMG